jgi:hypothetical protein
VTESYAGYAPPRERPPFAAYATFAIAFHGALAGAVAAAKRSGRDLPELEGKGGPAELEEHPRGSGLRRAMGELLVCPYCLGLWASGAFHAGLLFAPRATRFSASVLTAMTISDFLQIAYKAAEDRGLED